MFGLQSGTPTSVRRSAMRLDFSLISRGASLCVCVCVCVCECVVGVGVANASPSQGGRQINFQ